MIRITASVGQGGFNRASDVRVVQRALRLYKRRYIRGREISETGQISFDVVETIKHLQRRLGEDESGRLEPVSPALRALDQIKRTAGISFGANTFAGARNTVEILVSDGRFVSMGSQWGHVAIDVGGTVYSRGHADYYVMPRATYLERNSFRETVGLVLEMSAKEVAVIASELRRRVALKTPYDLVGNSCSTNVADVLEKVGVLAHDPRYQWDASRRTAVSPKEILIIVSRSSRLQRRNIYPKQR
ncbi:hypothetical protein [Achromobacter sp. MFA1 R4]|uniref:hypothetical protein n=1 Tax=Achromobacter sp. MFA1 R4 TaxID=1881016 RepID=UPI0018D455AF|nr:hypothetical protein [Achromobacter sp. MFA1 R4]